MKQIKNELDVDFIGGNDPLTDEEKRRISEFINASKQSNQTQNSQQIKSSKKHITVGGAD